MNTRGGTNSSIATLATGSGGQCNKGTGKPSVQLNQQFVISQEVIDKIRAAADEADKKPAICE